MKWFSFFNWDNGNIEYLNMDKIIAFSARKYVYKLIGNRLSWYYNKSIGVEIVAINNAGKEIVIHRELVCDEELAKCEDNGEKLSKIVDNYFERAEGLIKEWIVQLEISNCVEYKQ